MESLMCKNCRRWHEEAPFSTPDDVWKHCDDLDLFTTPETECLARPVSKDSSEEDEDEWDFYYEDDADLEVGYDPYLGCYSEDC